MAEIVELRVGDIDSGLESAWDSLPPARGTQADIYDSYAWLSGWLRAAPESMADRVRIPAVFDNGRPIALLPLVMLRNGQAEVAGLGSRTRARPIVGTESPPVETLGLLAEAVARSGVRALSLHRLPTRDPATATFADVLREVGFRVHQHERSCDNIAHADGGWEEYARRLKGFASYAKRFTNRLSSLWDLEIDVYGDSPERSVAAGFRVYEEMQRRSWKGEFTATVRQHRLDLLNRAEAHGWVRIFVLRIDGVAVAAHTWFRLGDVATWLSTAYDQRLGALSPGTVVMWQAQTKIFAHDPPHVVDLLPGANPQKERLTLERPPLLVTEAIRPTPYRVVAGPVQRHVSRVRTAAVARLRARKALGAEAPPAPARRLTGTVTPNSVTEQAWRLELEPAMRRYLAAALGQPSPDAMAASWTPADEWWVVGSRPYGLIRLNRGGSDIEAREIVVLDRSADPRAVARYLATSIDSSIELDGAMAFESDLPWPRSWRQPGADPSRTPIAPGRS